MELPSVPLRDRVLRRLRRLRRPAHGAARLDRRRDRRRTRRADDEADGTTTHHYLSGGRARLRVDDEPGLRRAARDVRAPDAAARGDAPAAAAGARGPGGAPFRRDARRAEVLRRVVRPLPVRPHHDRRSRVAERRRRHGVSDALHGRHALARAARTSTIPKTSRSTKPAISSGTASSRPTSSSTRGWTKGSTRSRPRARWSSGSNRPTTSSATSAASCRGCFADLPLSREIDGDRLGGYRLGATRRRAVDAELRYWPGTAGAITYNKTALWLHTLERMLGWDDAAADAVDLLRALRVQASDGRRTSSPWPTRSAAAT